MNTQICRARPAESTASPEEKKGDAIRQEVTWEVEQLLRAISPVAGKRGVPIRKLSKRPRGRPCNRCGEERYPQLGLRTSHAILSSGMAAGGKSAKRWLVHGRVQGVGFRYFAKRAAAELGLTGYVRNLEDGAVEVYAAGPPEQLSRLAALLQRGPRGAEVRTVDERPAEMLRYASFVIEP